jgi:hypothetical protein
MMQQPADDNLLKPKNNTKLNGDDLPNISKKKNSLFEYT